MQHFLGDAIAAPDAWQHLRTVLRIQTQVFDAKTGELKSEDDRYLISSLPKLRLSLQHWLLVTDAPTETEIVRLRTESE